MLVLRLALLLALAGTASAHPIDTWLRRAEAFGFDGQVLVEKDGRVLVDEAYGFADRERLRRTSRETTFGIASQTKQFTATAILLLEARGKLSNDDPIARHLDGVPAGKAAITIGQLLSHTSGLPPGDVIEDFAPISADALIRRILDLELKTPGEWRYSNAGYNLLAAIVERVSGKPYAQFLREELFRPAGMKRTGIIGIDRAENGAVAYRGLRPQGSLSEWRRNMRTWGGGDAFSTAHDLYRWELALRSGKILPAAQLEKLFLPRVKLESDWYAFGWFVGTTPRGTKLIEHGGDTELGFNCAYKRFVDEKATIIILSNRSEVNGPWLRWLVQPHIEALLFNKEAFELPAIARPATVADGVYRSVDGAELLVRNSGRQVIVSSRNAAASIILFGAKGDAESLSKAAAKTAALLRRAISGEAREAFTEALTAEAAQYAGEYLDEWNALLSRHGQLRNAKVVGCVVRGNAARAMVELESEKGPVAMTFNWRAKGEGRLGGTAVGEGVPLARVFAPIATGQLAAVHFPSKALTRITVADGRLVIDGVSFAPPATQLSLDERSDQIARSSSSSAVATRFRPSRLAR